MVTDLALGLLRHGYGAIPRARAERERRDAFAARLLGRRAVVVCGRDGVDLFYDPDLIQRSGAIPPPLAGLLFGRGAVHGLDGSEHAERKRMFLDILREDRTRELATTIGRDLERRIAGWDGREVSVFDELVEVYGVAVQAWAGVEDDPARACRRARQLAAIVDGFGFSFPAYPRAWAARLLADRWAERLIASVRAGTATARPDSVLADLATGPGAELSPRVAGVELLNILRPTVAVAWPGTFLARALIENPRARAGLGAGDRAEVSLGHEVRRTCPFVPALAGRARHATRHGDVDIAAGDMVVLDVPGTDHDPAWWTAAEEFRADRFRHGDPDPFAYVPQGGGDPSQGHRCPGEPLTVAILAETARVLGSLDLEPAGPTTHDPRRIPALPSGGLRVRARRR